MDLENTHSGILLRNAADFEPGHIFECGQCFRWNAMPDGSYTGVAGGRALRVQKKGGYVLFDGTNRREFREYWVGYFDLGRDYGHIKKELCRDPVMARAVEYGYGIRILKQDPWETLVSFIISANNGIPRIKKTIEMLCRRYGRKFTVNGEIYYDFPTPRCLALLSREDITACGCGYRAKYLSKAAEMVVAGKVDLVSLSEMSTGEVREVLMGIPGVGPKVADCVMLFSMARLDAFPVDVWIKRVMEHYYLKKDTSLNEIRRHAQNRFGPLAGVAQQYLFYYARGTMGQTGAGR